MTQDLTDDLRGLDVKGVGGVKTVRGIKTIDAPEVERHPAGERPTASVVVCCYTEARWTDLCGAVDSARAQLAAGDDIVLVVDNNDALLRRAVAAMPAVAIVPSTGPRGLSGARNTGIAATTGDVVVFLDDDARAEPGWLERMLAPYADPRVMGVGGAALAAWPTDRPGWFPPEFDWVVGCSYAGLPTSRAPVRNPIGASMSFRRSAFEAVGDFTHGIGRTGTDPMGCEETEFGIRLRQSNPDAVVLYEPGSVVAHRVTTDRTTFTYFRRRCYAEGLSKARVAGLVGQESALEAERTYVSRTLPRAVWRDLTGGGHRARAAAVVFGVATTSFGYVRGRLGLRRLAS
ncbi:glycosyltransferase [Frankia sp. AiPs1]|uniref:glycosyltransferase n=1 Tax=Frankia sp. AiPs1 TaxID=573493 RepID=UPI002043AD63|nr:glycosyltransferase family 2 protein [Frankia sp. AiPs1]MCM3923486.1 glycosyltransferase [Frankia sp. AiPs1]